MKLPIEIFLNCFNPKANEIESAAYIYKTLCVFKDRPYTTNNILLQSEHIHHGIPEISKETNHKKYENNIFGCDHMQINLTQECWSSLDGNLV